MILHEHICKLDLGCIEVLSRNQKLCHAAALFLASLREDIMNLFGETGIQDWKLRLESRWSVENVDFQLTEGVRKRGEGTHNADIHFEYVIDSKQIKKELRRGALPHP